MKKLITLILMVCCLSASAQHLKFLGIPLNADVSLFEKALKEKGYESYLEINGAHIFIGGYFHDMPYKVKITLKNGYIYMIKLECTFETYEDAMGEINELVRGTVEKHPEYERVSSMFKKMEEDGEMFTFSPKGNKDEKLTIGLWADDEHIYAQMLYQVSRRTYKTDDL